MLDIARNTVARHYKNMLDDANALARPGWTILMVDNYSVRTGKIPDTDYAPDEDPSAPSLCYNTPHDLRHLRQWGLRTQFLAREEDVYVGLEMTQYRVGVEVDVRQPPKIRGPGHARAILRLARYTNRQIKNMPISGMKRLAQRWRGVLVQITVHGYYAVDHEEKRVYVGPNSPVWFAWVVLNEELNQEEDA